MMRNPNYDHEGMTLTLQDVEVDALALTEGVTRVAKGLAADTDQSEYAVDHLDEHLKRLAEEARKLSDRLNGLRRYVKYPAPAFQKPQRDWAVAP